MTGADTEDDMASLVSRLGGKQIKCTSPGTIGTADRLIAFKKSGAFFVEVKMRNESIRPAQRKQAREWVAVGVPCYVVRSWKAASWLIHKAHEGKLPKPGVYR